MESEAGAKGPAARSAEGRQKLSGHVPRQYVHQSRTQQRETQSSHSQYLWDWVDVELDKHDVDYIALHCATRNELSPALRKRGKKWYLDFSFEEKVILDKGVS